jgi:hypothetical protein
MFRVVPLSIIRSLFFVHSTLYDIYQCRMYILIMGRGTTRNMWSFRVLCQNKFGKLVHLVCFIIKKFEGTSSLCIELGTRRRRAVSSTSTRVLLGE